MKKVFLLNSDPLQISTWKSYLKDTQWSLYTLSSLSDFSFRFEDFQPDLVVYESEMGTEGDLEQIIKIVSQIPVAVVGESFGKRCLGFSIPYNPENLVEILNELLAKSKEL